MAGDLEGQVSGSAAEIYEAFFVPALFGPWAQRVADVAELRPGIDVLDVACGTGVLARAAAGRVAPGGTVTGLDRNPGMLEVARRLAPGLHWQEGRAEVLPFPDRSFDAVLCQFGLMFFEGRAQALREMARVRRSGGVLALAVWDRLDASPGYAAMARLLDRLFGRRAAAELEAPFALGGKRALASLLEEAGLAGAAIRTEEGTACFPSLESWLYTDIRGWTLAGLIDEQQYRHLCEEAPEALGRFLAPDGSVAFPIRAHLVTLGGG